MGIDNQDVIERDTKRIEQVCDIDTRLCMLYHDYH